jgi:hypothetical protein
MYENSERGANLREQRPLNLMRAIKKDEKQ